VMPHFEVLLTDGSRVVIYDRKMFIKQAIGCADDAMTVSITTFNTKNNNITIKNDTQHNDNQRNEPRCWLSHCHVFNDTQLNDTKHNDTRYCLWGF